ncbi:MAG: glycosyltransferase family 2 protein [Acidimicrobiales bacterium]
MGILTYRRREGLPTTVRSVAAVVDRSASPPVWQLRELLIVDNDPDGSAQGAAVDLAAEIDVPVRYIHEATPGLAAARNRALDEADGDVLVFIDDDEEAEPGWPDGLLGIMDTSGAALVGGPVRTRFAQPPPSWVVEGRFFERPEPADGSTQAWLRSGNLAVDLAAVRAADLRFSPAFAHTGGEDVDFTRRAAAAGLDLRWSATAAVTETVPPDRARLRWVTARERRSTASWVRVELALDPRRRRRALVTVRAMVRAAQAMAVATGGILGRRRHRIASAAVLASRALGAIDGLRDRRLDGYGPAASQDGDQQG